MSARHLKTGHTVSKNLLSLVVAGLLVAAPAMRVHAQDEDMPDGDVDLVDKPKKKAPPKKEEPKKEEPKKDDKKKKADEKKAADDKKAAEEKKAADEQKKADEKARKADEKKAADDKKAEDKKAADDKKAARDAKAKKPAADDDSDILTVGADDPKLKPKEAPKTKTDDKKKPAAGDDENEGGASKSHILEAVDAPVAPTVDDDLPVHRAAPPLPVEHDREHEKERKPAHSEPVGEPKLEPLSRKGAPSDDDLPTATHRTPVTSDAGDREVDAADAGAHPGDAVVTQVDTKPKEPESSDDGGMGWVIAGATGGGLVLLAAAGVGGYFLVDALTPKTGTITVTPR